MKKTLYAILGLVLLVSCSDNYLDRLPDTTVGETQEFFNSESGLKTYSNVFYSFVNWSSVTNDMNSDNCEHTTSPASIHRGDIYVLPTAQGSNGWSWTQLRTINYFLQRVEASTVSDEIKTSYRALARFFRALFYFEKVKAFGDVPWYDRVLNTDDTDQLYKPRDPRSDVMAYVLEDINYACEHLQAVKYRNTITKYTALAWKSRICLFEGTWLKYRGEDGDAYLSEAVKAAEELIASNAYGLYTTGNPKSDFRNMFLAQSVSTDEVIQAYSWAEANFHAYTCFYTVPSRGQYGATRSLVNDFDMADGTCFYDAYPDKEVRDRLMFGQECAGRDPRLAQSIVTPGYIRAGSATVSHVGDFSQNRTGYQITKRVGPTTEEDQGDNRDQIIIRYAEVLLNYAEAKAELGTLTQDDLDKTVNAIRARVGMPARTLPLKASDAQKAMYTRTSDENVLEIRRERRVELAFEGFRNDDIRRWNEGHLFRETYEGIYVPALDKLIDLDGDGTNDIYIATNGKLPDAGNREVGVSYIELQASNGLSNGTSGRFIPYTAPVEPWKDWEYLSAIPTEEITINPNLVQNPGWVDIVK